MVRSRVKVKLNRGAVRRRAQVITAAAEDVLNTVARTHAGRSAPEVRAALEAETRRRGLKMNWDDEAVDRISAS